jgi:arylformamidase
MKTSFTWHNQTYYTMLNEPIDISLYLQRGNDNPLAFYTQGPVMEPLKVGGFVGSVAQGGACNCEVIQFTPHCNGTHTESIGHITPHLVSIGHTLKEFFCLAIVVSIEPEQAENGDCIIMPHQLSSLASMPQAAVILRTMPNNIEKRYKNYSGQNPIYLHYEAATLLREKGFKHLLIDTPSVDREEDGGALLAHKAWWNYPLQPRLEATISELIYVPNDVPDGLYLLNLMVPNFGTDAAPSRPVLYAIHQ